MTDQSNVFGDQPVTPPVDTTPVQIKPEDLLKNIKNEHGEQKYKTLEDALVALDHSQKYIPELKNQLTGTNSELQALKEQVGKFSNIEETVQRLLEQQTTPTVTPVEVTGLDEQAVRKLVADSLNTERVNATLSSNQQKVNDALLGKFGDKAVEMLDVKAKELGTTRQALGELAKQSPDVVLALFGNPVHKDSNPTVSNQRTPVPKPVIETSKKPDHSLLSGIHANRKEQGNRFAELRNEVYTKYGIDS